MMMTILFRLTFSICSNVCISIAPLAMLTTYTLECDIEGLQYTATELNQPRLAKEKSLTRLWMIDNSVLP